MSSRLVGKTCFGSFKRGSAIFTHCSKNLGSHVPPSLSLELLSARLDENDCPELKEAEINEKKS